MYGYYLSNVPFDNCSDAGFVFVVIVEYPVSLFNLEGKIKLKCLPNLLLLSSFLLGRYVFLRLLSAHTIDTV